MRLPYVALFGALLFAACQPTTSLTPSPPAESKAVPTSTSAAQVGILAGRVTIGPLTPVERVDVPTPTVPPEMYAAHSIQVFQADGATLVANVKINPDGAYHVELPPGTYVVDLPKIGLERAARLPTTITITAGQTTRLDIDIDTGIR